jgi:hypothetical protein
MLLDETLFNLDEDWVVEAAVLKPDLTFECPLSLLLLVELQVDMGLALEPRSKRSEFRYALEDLTEADRLSAEAKAEEEARAEEALPPEAEAGDMGASFQELALEELRPLLP